MLWTRSNFLHSDGNYMDPFLQDVFIVFCILKQSFRNVEQILEIQWPNDFASTLYFYSYQATIWLMSSVVCCWQLRVKSHLLFTSCFANHSCFKNENKCSSRKSKETCLRLIVYGLFTQAIRWFIYTVNLSPETEIFQNCIIDKDGFVSGHKHIYAFLINLGGGRLEIDIRTLSN